MAEIGEMGEVALAAEKVRPELGLDQLDRAGQRRLGHVAVLGRAREVERPRHGQEITDLMHFHGAISTPPRGTL
jgi:hypothetical protein